MSYIDWIGVNDSLPLDHQICFAKTNAGATYLCYYQENGSKFIMNLLSPMKEIQDVGFWAPV